MVNQSPATFAASEVTFILSSRTVSIQVSIRQKWQVATQLSLNVAGQALREANLVIARGWGQIKIVPLLHGECVVVELVDASVNSGKCNDAGAKKFGGVGQKLLFVVKDNVNIVWLVCVDGYCNL